MKNKFEKPGKENLIHVKLSYEEAVISKKYMLYLQKDLIELIKTLKRYQFLRSREFERKIYLEKKLSEIKKMLGKLHILLPKTEIPKRYKESSEKETDKFVKEINEKEDDTLESQLRDIQQKLRMLGG